MAVNHKEPQGIKYRYVQSTALTYRYFLTGSPLNYNSSMGLLRYNNCVLKCGQFSFPTVSVSHHLWFLSFSISFYARTLVMCRHSFAIIDHCLWSELSRDKVGRPPGELGVSKSMECDIFPSVLWHCWLGDRKGIRPVKELDVGLLVVMIWLELCTTYSSSSPVVTTTSIILCFNKHRLTQVHLENGC